jgi:hypothetical protein
MSDEIERVFQLAKTGEWGALYEATKSSLVLAGKVARFIDESGWSALHHAAAFGDENAVAWCLRHGTSLGLLTNDSKLAQDIATDRGHIELANRLASAAPGAGWEPTDNPEFLAASSLWGEARKVKANQFLRVCYSGRLIDIPPGNIHYTDSWGRILVGWHGSFSPPRGMDGESMIAPEIERAESRFCCVS